MSRFAIEPVSMSPSLGSNAHSSTCSIGPISAAGLEEVWRSLTTVEYFDLEAIVEYAALLGNATTVARVGFFLETHRERLMVGDAHLAGLRRRRPRQPRYFEKRNTGKGRFVAGWNLVVPDSVMRQVWEEPS